MKQFLMTFTHDDGTPIENRKEVELRNSGFYTGSTGARRARNAYIKTKVTQCKEAKESDDHSSILIQAENIHVARAQAKEFSVDLMDHSADSKLYANTKFKPCITTHRLYIDLNPIFDSLTIHQRRHNSTRDLTIIIRYGSQYVFALARIRWCESHLPRLLGDKRIRRDKAKAELVRLDKQRKQSVQRVHVEYCGCGAPNLHQSTIQVQSISA